VSKNALLRVLDLGCGTGAQLIDVAAAFKLAQCVGIDLSWENVTRAREIAAVSEACARLRFEHGDYLTFAAGPFDVILADSVLQNIPVSTTVLAGKIGDDLNPEGLLVVSIPYDCVFNRLLWMGRRILRLVRGPVLEWFVLMLARLLYPSWSPEMIRERLPYLYLVPARFDGEQLRDVFRIAGRLAILQEQRVPHASLAQPKHRLVVFRKLPS
jgi:trans-aconitate 2-methyltransferase